MAKAITLVQIDVETCGNVYGVAPCTAELGVTGENKCFNTRKTCQDVPNFTQQFTTITFARPADYVSPDYNALQCVEAVNFSPATVSLGENLGVRASITVTMKDFRHTDVGFDEYRTERTYDPYEQGTFFGKFRARQPFLRGKNLRLLRGFEGQDIAEFETWHFVIESFDGPTPDGKYTLIAKDVLKLADGDRAQAPNLSSGFLTASITDSDTSFTIGPAGTGDAEYPASGSIAVGGKEMMSFTRVGDVFTVVRGQEESDAIAHDADSRVQLALVYTAEDPGDIIQDLLVTYAGVDASFIDLTAWNVETSSFLGTVYTATIAQPTSIKTLCSELIEQAALSLFWEPLTQQIKLKVLRQIQTDAATFNNDDVMSGSMQSAEQPDKRISQVWTFFAKVNPLLQLDDPESYRSSVVTIDTDAEIEYDQTIIKKIFSRWIPLGGRTIASRVNDVQLSRFRDPPRKFNFRLFHDATIVLGEGYQIGAYQLQNDLGEEVNVPIQVTRLSKNSVEYSIEGEEVLFQDLEPIDPDDHTIIFDSNSQNVNLKTVHDSLFPEATATTVVSAYVQPGVIIGSDDTAQVAFDVGTGWDAGTTIILYVLGRIQGTGGNGGNGGSNSSTAGFPGGDALLTTRAITVDFENTAGEIWSGGGGGGAGHAFQGSSVGGGGGAGTIAGNGGSSVPAGLSFTAPEAGTSEVGGDGGQITGPGINVNGGEGGGPGLAGATATGGASNKTGGAAGNAVDGVSFVTYLNDGSADIRGAQVN